MSTMESSQLEQPELSLELGLQYHYSCSSPEREPQGLFLCVYCDRKFYNSQALGGHQNAHREERNQLAKRRRDIAAATRAHSAAACAASVQVDAARIGNRNAGFLPAAAAAMRNSEEDSATVSGLLALGRNFPEHAGERTADGQLDLSLRLYSSSSSRR